jgi:hypothetical protein
LDEVRFESVGSWGMDHHSKRLIKGYLFRWPGMEGLANGVFCLCWNHCFARTLSVACRVYHL